ncbi:site-2 protease family protein [Candidatus Ruminimicrobium bovinum]|uniref:site-2 protease family protein n=1 Tax=Candidatus Ruminimicrobium bovinum TaxID=3242779 RepID=UPI0039B830F5
MSFLIIIHELGHLLMALLLGGELIKINIYPLGGISKFKFDLNISIIKEFLVLISGPIMQIIGYFILVNILKDYNKLISIYHYSILIFNLVPIYPLDGGRILNLFLSIFIPYKKSLILSIILSIIFIVLIFSYFIFNNITINIVVISIFLLYKVIIEYKNIDYLYERFLLERYLNNYNFKKGIIINKINNFRRSKRHLIKINNNYYLEKDILEKKYKRY